MELGSVECADKAEAEERGQKLGDLLTAELPAGEESFAAGGRPK